MRKDSFDLEALGAEASDHIKLNTEDADIRRLQEDAAVDLFKTLEKFLAYWLPLQLKSASAPPVEE